MVPRNLSRLIALVLLAAGVAQAQVDTLRPRADPLAAPDAASAARMFDTDAPLTVLRIETPPQGWRVEGPNGLVGYIGSTWELAQATGYSGQPIDVLVGVTPEAVIAGSELVRQSEPVLTLGISEEDIAAYVDAFRGIDLTAEQVTAFGARSDLPDVIARATVSTGVIRDAILRTARTLALGRGLVGQGAGRMDRTSWEAADWPTLIGWGALAHLDVPMAEARDALSEATVPLPEDGGSFFEMWAGILDPPTIGRNLLGQQDYSRLVAQMDPADAALLVASRGLHTHRGIDWRRSGVFDRIEVHQGSETITLTEEDFLRIDALEVEGAPELREISAFRLEGARFDPTAPFRVVVTATRPTGDGEAAFRMELPYSLPADFLLAPPEETPLWVSAWTSSVPQIAGVGAMLTVLTGILFFQQQFVKRPRLWQYGRYAFLTVTLVWLGWMAGGQLSVVQVVAFLQSLLTGFRWETFLIEPVIFILWSFVTLGILFWGRGVFCGWLCPFGALQELSNAVAKRLGVPQVAVPLALHERLWVVKYTLFVVILGLSFYSMKLSLIAAEAEPFKTAISMRFMRAWPFVAFALAVLAASLFIERFYCRYVCPLGAALAIPAKLKIFDWLRRRPQCGRECRLCEVKCPVGAIDPLGRINPNECVLCLRCQTILHDPQTCPVLVARANRRAQTTAAST